ncbi:MAG: alpha/beta fold hydrolase [Pseudomonadota bacterium]|nr:alpha/beta fold hydrolase [Pseudomonadota bacterium]
MSTQHWVESGGIRLAARSWGDAGNPTIILVHGYPDCSHVWDAVAQQLSRDFHVIAYDVRGAGESDVPKAQRDYALAQLAADTVAVADALAPDKPFHLVGHDWGSIQSWETVTTPELQTRIASYTSMSGPCLDHVGHWSRAQPSSGSRLTRFFTQLRQSWYIAAFQLPGAPLAWNLGMAKLWPRVLLKTEGIRVEPSPSQLKDGRNGINLYRANVLPCLLRPRERHTEVPVQLLVALRDPYVQTALFEGLTRWAPKLWRRVMDKMHWMPLSAPVEVAEHIAEFVQFADGGPESDALRAARVVEA